MLKKLTNYQTNFMHRKNQGRPLSAPVIEHFLIKLHVNYSTPDEPRIAVARWLNQNGIDLRLLKVLIHYSVVRKTGKGYVYTGAEITPHLCEMIYLQYCSDVGIKRGENVGQMLQEMRRDMNALRDVTFNQSVALYRLCDKFFEGGLTDAKEIRDSLFFGMDGFSDPAEIMSDAGISGDSDRV